MDDDMQKWLRENFSGDLVPGEAPPDTTVRRIDSRLRVRRDVHHQVVEPPASPVTAAKFRRLMETMPALPAAPSVPTRQFLIEDKAHVTRWLEEAKNVESDARLGQAVEPHQVTRLLLEAIPVVETFASATAPASR